MSSFPGLPQISFYYYDTRHHICSFPGTRIRGTRGKTKGAGKNKGWLKGLVFGRLKEYGHSTSSVPPDIRRSGGHREHETGVAVRDIVFGMLIAGS
jgi:hypothetical protein